LITLCTNKEKTTKMKKKILMMFVFMAVANDVIASSYIISSNASVYSGTTGDIGIFNFRLQFSYVNDLDLTLQSFRKDPSISGYLYGSGIVYGIYNSSGILVESGISKPLLSHLSGALISDDVATVRAGMNGLFDFTSTFQPQESGFYQARVFQLNTVETDSHAGFAFVDPTGLTDRTNFVFLNSIPELSTAFLLFGGLLGLLRRRK